MWFYSAQSLLNTIQFINISHGFIFVCGSHNIDDCVYIKPSFGGVF